MAELRSYAGGRDSHTRSRHRVGHNLRSRRDPHPGRIEGVTIGHEVEGQPSWSRYARHPSLSRSLRHERHSKRPRPSMRTSTPVTASPIEHFRWSPQSLRTDQLMRQSPRRLPLSESRYSRPDVVKERSKRSKPLTRQSPTPSTRGEVVERMQHRIGKPDPVPAPRVRRLQHSSLVCCSLSSEGHRSDSGASASLSTIALLFEVLSPRACICVYQRARK